MPPRRWFALLLLVQSGCLWTAETERSAWVKRFSSQAISPDHAVIQVAKIERPAGDDYINHVLWQHTKELIVELDRHGILEENGIRIGQIVGTPPSAFQQMLLDKRSCSAPEGLIFPAGRVMPIYLGAIREKATYKIVQNKTPSEVTLELPRFAFNVSASFVADGRTKLNFTPIVENGETVLPFEPKPEQSTWELRPGRASRKYPDLSWDVTLAPNQYLLIGGRTDRIGTLGATTFLQQETGVQRLLVIRNCRSVTAHEASEGMIDELMRTEKSTPLALQATVAGSRSKMR